MTTMAVGEIDGSDFAAEYARRKNEIDRLAHTQRVPGLDRDEVRAELLQALWRAFQAYDPGKGTTLGQLWWAVWMNRKVDLIAAFFAAKSPGPYTTTTDADFWTEVLDTMHPFIDLADLCPSTDRTERAVWALLCQGFTGIEVRSVLGLSVRRFYAIIDRWRTPEVWSLLS